MRAPKRKHPLIRTIATPPDGVILDKIADGAAYIGSSEHKSHPSFAGPPNLRRDASRCDPAFAGRQDDLTEWIRESIREGRTGAPWEDRYPRYVWRREGDIVYEGRLVNRVNGEYKGYPLEPGEGPEGI